MCRSILSTFAAALSLFATTSCQTPESAADPEEATDGAERLESRVDIDVEQLFSRAEQLRDREFEERPRLAANGEPLEATGHRESAEAETTVGGALTPALFGFSGGTPEPHSPLREVAQYDADGHRIVFHRGDASVTRLRIALLAAMVRALDAQHFDAVPEGRSTDRRLARFAASEADVMLVVAAYLYARQTGTKKSALQTIAARPELSLQLDGLSSLLQPPGTVDDETPIKSADDLASRMTTFGLREGLSLAAALYRSAGWSGVELLFQRFPGSTADVVRPDRWMAGKGLGTWKWPQRPDATEPFESDRDGRVGPALASIWLSQAFRPERARTIYSGWRSDRFRFQRIRPAGDAGASDDKAPGWRFEWLQQWDTPTSARQVATACRTVLRDTHGKPRKGSVRWDVFRRGLHVGVVARRQPGTSYEAADLASYLLQSEPTFRPRDGLPLDFQPTRTESFRRQVQNASVDDGTWRDPASKLRVNVAPLQNWTFRLSKTLPLRWFGRRGDGTTVQLTTELANPLGPAFGSDGYRQSLRGTFTKSLEDAEFQGPTTNDNPVSPTLVFSVVGTKSKSTWRIKAWQFKRGDVVSTLSLQAPDSQFSRYEKTAEKVVESVSTKGRPPGPSGRPNTQSSGSIEYEFEE